VFALLPISLVLTGVLVFCCSQASGGVLSSLESHWTGRYRLGSLKTFGLLLLLMMCLVALYAFDVLRGPNAVTMVVAYAWMESMMFYFFFMVMGMFAPRAELSDGVGLSSSRDK
jgi:hypothetical protein